jgi:hypothetical protein
MSKSISRAHTLAVLGSIPLAVAAGTAAALAADDSAGTKAKYKYISKPGPAGQVCAGCSLFKAPAACVLVKGNISPKGYCVAYVPKAKS